MSSRLFIIDILLLFIYFMRFILYAYLISCFIHVKCRKVVAVNLQAHMYNVAS